ncbi:unnamed protein product [Echinostoma caproni]|uniref:BZIP domain-containing protein n=1 Tax=Echinostoma caproni TaxID=27848 RepID=A0A183A8G3_9TREM|nr:unnamed protein product [Echinostoma caproni]
MKPSELEASELQSADLIPMKAGLCPETNGTLLTSALSHLPETIINSIALRNNRTFSTTSLPLTGIPNLNSELIQSPFATSLSSASSASPLTSALLCSVLGTELRPSVPQLATRLRASSCQPLGRFLLNPTDPNWRWPDPTPSVEETPLDLSKKSPTQTERESPSEISNQVPLVTTVSVPMQMAVSISPVQESGKLQTEDEQPASTNTGTVRRRRTTASRRLRKIAPSKCLPLEENNAETQKPSRSEMMLLSSSQPPSHIRYPTMSDTEDYKTTIISGTTDVTTPQLRGRRSHSASDTRTSETCDPTHALDDAPVSDVSTNSETWSLSRPTALIPSHRTSNSAHHTGTRPTGQDPTVCNPRMRRYPEMTPNEVKDQAYWEKRVKNNEAARRSRRARKSKEQSLRDYAERLEKANTQLLQEIKLLKQEVARLKSETGQKNGGEKGSE